MADNRPRLAITLGDPAGIGPEVVLKALQHREVFAACRPIVVGDRGVLDRAAAWLDIQPQYEGIVDIGGSSFDEGTVPLLDLANVELAEAPVGEVSAGAGRAAVEYVMRACDLAMAGEVEAVVTAPLNKEAMHRAGFLYPGHTELLAERTGAERVSMLLVGPNLRVVHVSTHVALEEAIRRVTPARVLEVIELAYRSCRMLGVEAPRIAVAGLNPHASENGLFGVHEEEQIQPAIEMARERGWTVSDPQAPDTVFLRATRGEYDIVVAMYHDQGHIPMKLLAFDSGVNVSIGLPIIRTSVDHGTAFDIAGTGRASEESMLAAVRVAVTMAKGSD